MVEGDEDYRIIPIITEYNIASMPRRLPRHTLHIDVITQDGAENELFADKVFYVWRGGNIDDERADDVTFQILVSVGRGLREVGLDLVPQEWYSR